MEKEGKRNANRRKGNGNGMETEWKQNGNEMETEWKRNGNGMETEWKWNRTERGEAVWVLDGIYMEYDGYELGKERG